MMNVINIRNDKHKISPGYGRKSPDFENVTEQVMLERESSRVASSSILKTTLCMSISQSLGGDQQNNDF